CYGPERRKHRNAVDTRAPKIDSAHSRRGTNMNPIQDEELTLLWRQGALAEPNPEEIARLAERASMTQFDRTILRRNRSEYVAGLVLLVLFGWGVVAGNDPALDPGSDVIGIVCVAFVMGYLWWQHRHLTAPDPSADGRAYQAAMLARIDKQIRLVRRVRYWYVLPLSLPGVWMVFQIVRMHDTGGLLGNYRPLGAVLFLALQTGVGVGVVWLNERRLGGKLWAERAKIERLY